MGLGARPSSRPGTTPSGSRAAPTRGLHASRDWDHAGHQLRRIRRAVLSSPADAQRDLEDDRMKWLRTHPDADVLSGYANRTLDEGDQRSIADHLESCEPCRDSVMILRQLTVSEGGALPPRVLDKVLEGRTTGRRVILPVDDSADPGGRRLSLWTRGAIAAGSIAAALLLLLQRRQGTSGGRSRPLRFHPPRALLGATLTPTYSPSPLLHPYDSLTLSSPFRRPPVP